MPLWLGVSLCCYFNNFIITITVLFIYCCFYLLFIVTKNELIKVILIWLLIVILLILLLLLLLLLLLFLISVFSTLCPGLYSCISCWRCWNGLCSKSMFKIFMNVQLYAITCALFTHARIEKLLIITRGLFHTHYLVIMFNISKIIACSAGMAYLNVVLFAMLMCVLW